MSESAELLSKPTNYAVVQLPGRKFPGVVIQGDSLHTLVKRLSDLHLRSEKYRDEELTIGLNDLLEILSEASIHYESICKERGIPLPYPTE